MKILPGRELSDTLQRMRFLFGLFAIESKSLLAFRIALGLLLIFDFSERLYQYIANKHATIALFAGGSFFNGTLGLNDIVLGLVGIGLIGGYRPRLSIVLSWLLLVLRYLPEQGGTTYGFKILTAILFWCLFLPFEDTAPHIRKRYLSVASAAVLIQLAVIYFSAGITKSPDCWFITGGALQCVLRSNNSSIVSSPLITYCEPLWRFSSRVVFLLETCGPLLLFVPIKTWIFRIIVPLLIIVMHIGIAILMNLGIFPYISIVVWLLFLPDEFWQFFRKRESSCRSKIVIERTRTPQIIALTFLSFVLIVNIEQWCHIFGDDTYNQFRRVGLYFGIDQQWIMFNNPCVWKLD